MDIRDRLPEGRLLFGVRFFSLLFLWIGASVDLWSATTQLRVLVSLPAYFSWTAQIGGDFVLVEPLLPDNADPHHFQFRPKDLERVQRANLIILNGAGLEDWLKPALNRQAPDSIGKIVEISAGYPTNEWIFDGAESSANQQQPHPSNQLGTPNPHFWLDPVFASFAVTNILHILQQAAPAQADSFGTNASAYLCRLRQLDVDFSTFRKPLQAPSLVTVHPAFSYLCRRYQLTLVGSLETVPGVEPSPKQLSRLIQEIRSRHVTTLFTEPNSTSRLAKQLAVDLNLTTADLDTLEMGVWSANAYEEGMRCNLRTLARYLH